MAFIYYWSAGGAAGRCDVFVVIADKDIKEVLEKGNGPKEQEVYNGSCNTNPVIEWLSDAKLLIKYHSPKDDELGGIRIWKEPTSKDGKVTISVAEIK